MGRNQCDLYRGDCASAARRSPFLARCAIWEDDPSRKSLLRASKAAVPNSRIRIESQIGESSDES
jgi:hypothetical protein